MLESIAGHGELQGNWARGSRGGVKGGVLLVCWLLDGCLLCVVYFKCCLLSVVGCLLVCCAVVCCVLLVVGCWLCLFVGCWLVVVSCVLFVAGCWLVVGCCVVVLK